MAIALSSGVWQLLPAPCVITSPSPHGVVGSCSQPRTISRSNRFTDNLALSPYGLPSHADPPRDLEIGHELGQSALVLGFTHESSKGVPLAGAPAHSFRFHEVDVAARHAYCGRSLAHGFEVDLQRIGSIERPQRA